MTYARLSGVAAGVGRRDRESDRLADLVDEHDVRAPVRGGGRREMPLRQHTSTPASSIMNADAIGGVTRVERYVRAARLQHAEQARDHVRSALDADADAILGPHAEGAQARRDAAPPCAVEFGIRERAAAPAHRDGVGLHAHLVVDQVVDATIARERARRSGSSSRAASSLARR